MDLYISCKRIMSYSADTHCRALVSGYVVVIFPCLGVWKRVNVSDT